MRCMHEASMHETNSFLTLTYDDEHLPARKQLHYPHFQGFMKRLRKMGGQGIRFYMCGEYGPQTWRPHYHACIFGWDWPDKKHLKTTDAGEKIATSEILQRLWPHGMASTGAVTFESAAYVARYCVQKITGRGAEAHYARTDEKGPYQLTPEFNKMSLKPGIGARWFQQYKTDVYPHDHVIIRGVPTKPPKYYDTLLKRTDRATFDELKERRELDALANWEDNTDERLNVRKQVTEARLNLLHREQLL